MLNKNYHVLKKTTSNGVNQEKPSLKEEADKLMKIKGNVRGEIFLSHLIYIREKKGEKGVKMVEEKLRELGYPLNLEGIKAVRFYPEAHSILIILVAKEIFNWTDADIFEWGNAAPKYSSFMKILIKYFISLSKIFQETEKTWERYFDFGDLEPTEINEERNYLIIRLKEFKFHPIICIYHAGYFLRIAQFSIRSEKTAIEETKCVHKGDPYHEYVIRWK